MPTNFRIGDRVEDKETHKRGRVTFVYSTLELRDEFIAVLFDGRVETLAVPADSVRRVSTRQPPPGIPTLAAPNDVCCAGSRAVFCRRRTAAFAIISTGGDGGM
jgi:hypothetical protein